MLCYSATKKAASYLHGESLFQGNYYLSTRGENYAIIQLQQRLGNQALTRLLQSNVLSFERPTKTNKDKLKGNVEAAFNVPPHAQSKLPASLQMAAKKARLHNSRFAHKTAAELNVHAFTIGNDIYFGSNRWQPNTAEGLALLRHELGHISRGEGQNGTIEAWSASGHRTITRKALERDSRFSGRAKQLLENTAPVPDFNRPQILQDMISFWAGDSLIRAPVGFVGGALTGAITPPEQGSRFGNIKIGGIIPQAILGTGRIRTVPREHAKERPELNATRVPQELANHGEDLPERNEARTQAYIDLGIQKANQCDLYGGLVQVGYALHVAQDRGSHGDGYTAKYVQGKIPHSRLHDFSENSKGYEVALRLSKIALNQFYVGLSPDKRTALQNPLGLERTNPPVAATLLSTPRTVPIVAPPPMFPEKMSVQPGGINIFSIQF